MTSPSSPAAAVASATPQTAARAAAVLLLGALALALVAFAQHTVFGSGPYAVSAQSTQISPEANTAVLVGDVEVEQNGRRVRAPRITLTYDPPVRSAPHAAPSRSIRRLEAEGPVYFTIEDEAVRADHASFDKASGDLVLTGGVILTQGRDVSTGDRLVINEAKGTSVLTAAPGRRVRAVLYPR